MSRTTAVCLSVAVLLLSACNANETIEPSSDSLLRSMDITIESRGVAVPATLVLPAKHTDAGYPLVVMAHGHGGSRQEGGGYRMVAEVLAERGVATIRVDFPGCGDSSESFTENNLSNMLLDLEAARSFAAARDDIDAARLGLLGYSMGGRLAALLADRDPGYRVMALWAPAVENGSRRERLEFERLGGPDTYDTLKQRAVDTGVAEYETRWGSRLQLGPRWFTDLEETAPLEALAGFSGPLLVLFGELPCRTPVARYSDRMSQQSWRNQRLVESLS